MKIELAPDETLVREGGANMQRGWEAVGGKLALTTSRLVFASHAFNVQAGPAEIPLADIRDVTPAWTRFLGLIPVAPNSICVRTDRGTHRFVLYRRKEWIAAINAAAARRAA